MSYFIASDGNNELFRENSAEIAKKVPNYRDVGEGGSSSEVKSQNEAEKGNGGFASCWGKERDRQEAEAELLKKTDIAENL